MSKELSKGNRIILDIVEKGYYITRDGKAVGPTGIQLIDISDRGYNRINATSKNGERFRISAHRLQAYQKYGDRIFESGIHVRHLDGNSLNNSYDNIAIGTQSDNMMDQPKEIRKSRAKHAASYSKSLSDEEVRSLRLDRKEGMSYKQLMYKYKIVKSTVSFIVNRKTYADVE